MRKVSRIHRFIFNAMRSQMVQLVYEEPLKVTAKLDEMQWLFRCSDGRDYFMWKDTKQMPIRRQAEFINVFTQFITRFSDEEIVSMFKAMDAGMKEKKPDLGIVLFCIEEFNQRRSGAYFHKELFYHLMAICIINTDEPTDILSSDWKRKKCDLFEHDFENGLQEAVFNSPLVRFIPQLNGMDDYLSAFMDNGHTELMALQSVLTKATNGRRDKS